eukprot:2019192-Rhodomonas_salina.1
MASLIDKGMIEQVRCESGLCLMPGPRRKMGHLIFARNEPAPYLWGTGFDVTDEEAVVFTRRLVELIEERGVIWVPPNRLRDQLVPPYLVGSRAAKEDVIFTHLRTHLEYESGHFCLAIQSARRLASGVTDTNYRPQPWPEREENARAARAREASQTAPVPITGPMESEVQNGTGGDEMTEEIPRDVEEEMRAAISISAGQPSATELPSNVTRRTQNAPQQRPSGSILYGWLQGQLAEIVADLTVPQTVKEGIMQIESRMDLSLPTTEKLTYIATDPSMATAVHQPLARMALDEATDYESRMPLAEMAVDIHLIRTTQAQLGEVLRDSNLTPALSERISSITANHEFFAAVLRGIAGRSNHGGIPDADRAILRTMATDESLLALARAPAPQDTPTGPGQDHQSQISPRDGQRQESGQ